ncbi:uncharacterized protein LACBIDRAFT_319029 [Laccaria bicolor S238N-H82]|uniref:Predicted protein n=1 Tax=Laccaria bicolor (strain S238N-H82 / ATCC MYA-4686) TaxID=486041 RepID=B0D7P4_LACBS|nr:uncharacterized protein LACBIDRAFT_319029 [Laccaria bicolor S238N-H82]EDR09433.1 predicted protein [Laccaria bicolor S238N-H82]|eukprot:XP_001879782.1 predicted protein [Laccaria bicolor S238N-H82]
MATTTEIIGDANQLLAAHSNLIQRLRTTQQAHRRQLHSLHSPPHDLLRLPNIPSPQPSPPPHDQSPPLSPKPQQQPRSDLPPAKKARVARYRNYVPEEETIRNDYSQRYVDGGEWPQNWVLGAEPEHRFEEYPKQQRLLNLKKASVTTHSLPPTYIPYSQLTSLQPSKFDVILLDPPFSSTFTWDHLQEIPIPTLAADPSFVFLWVGSGAGEGLERGREVLAKWGYRRCEDVVWVKTNKATNHGPGTDPPTTSLLTRTNQHCLIGIRGTVRRSTDSWFVHCNVDTDVIIWEGDPTDPTRKPPEMYTLIENFCLGLRRLEVFGRPSSLRRGWVTILSLGQEEALHTTEDGVVYVEGEEGGRAGVWVQETWEEGIRELSGGGKPVVPMTAEIDALRPKSPFRPGQNTNAGPGGAGSNPGGGGMAGANRFATANNMNNRSGFLNSGGQNQMMGGQNQLVMAPMMGMGVHQLGGVDDMMGNWNPMMGVAGMGGPGMGVGLGMNMMGMGGGFGQPVFNGGWGDPSQAAYGLDAAWDGDGMMAMNVQGMMNGMNPMGPMGMGWGPFDGY